MPQACPRDRQQLRPQSHAVLASIAAAAAILTCSISSPAQAATAESNFGTKCVGEWQLHTTPLQPACMRSTCSSPCLHHHAGCHVNGGNIIQAGATLFEADLVKNGMSDSDSLFKIIYGGKARMPGFGQECAPKVVWGGVGWCM